MTSGTHRPGPGTEDVMRYHMQTILQTILQMCERWLFFIWLIPDVSHAKITATSYGSSPLNSTGFVTLRFDCIVLGFATPATRTFCMRFCYTAGFATQPVLQHRYNKAGFATLPKKRRSVLQHDFTSPGRHRHLG